MFRLPKKFSKWWYLIILVMFIILFGAFLSTRLLLETNINTTNMLGFAAIAAICTIIAGVGGLLGAKLYFSIISISYIIGIIYMLYIIGARVSDGWSDLVSIFSFIFIGSVGFIIGLIAQLVHYFIKR